MSDNRPHSRQSARSVPRSNMSEESTPLLSRSDDTPRYDGEQEEPISSPAASSLRSIQSQGRDPSLKSGKGRRWPTIIALSVLGTLVIIIMAAGFFAPAVVEEYAKQALVIEPTNLSIDSFTTTGVRARIQAKFLLDASRVQKDPIRNIGRAGTWIAREIESEEAIVEVYLPEYGNLLLGTAKVPKIVVNIRNGETTHIDFLADLEPGEMDGIRRLANDWLEGRLGQLRIQGKTNVNLKSGFVPLGTTSVSESLVFEGNELPAMPEYNITRLNFREVQLPSGHSGMAADVSLSFVNSYPIKLTIPPLGFDILVPNCMFDEPYILLADATTDTIDVAPKSDVAIEVGGVVRELPNVLTKACPKSNSSPLDLLLEGYIHGDDTTIFVRGSNSPSVKTPEWITKLTSSVTVPVPFPGHTFDNLIKNFSIENVHFSLPDPFAEPDSPDANAKISGNIEVIAGLPQEMNFGINVSRVRADADVFYKGKKLGILDLKQWQSANSTRIDTKKGDDAAIKIESQIKDAPLIVTDDDVFSDVIQAMIFNGKGVMLKIVADVDVEIKTVLGQFVIKKIPTEGEVPVKPLSSGGGFKNLDIKVGDIQVLDTGRSSINLRTTVNFTNPTSYSAQVPYINIHVLNNGSIIGHATCKDVKVTSGNNSNILVDAVWDPLTFGGEKGAHIGRELLSQYISGWNTTLTFRTHDESIPSQPSLGRSLSRFNVTIPTPRFGGPQAPTNGDDDNDDDEDHQGPHFIEEATFHLLSSTASFILLSPLQHSTIFIDHINATAFYNHTEPVGKILYEYPFQVPPGSSQTPRLPVVWSLDSVGYDKVRKALGGGLKLDAEATVGVRLGAWSEEVWYIGGGIGASVRL